MRKPSFHKPARIARVLVAMALAATVVAPVAAAPADSQMGKDQRAATMRSDAKSEANEPGTIPAARPGLPQLSRGAEGPLRTDTTKADPSLRDTNPLTANGLWETLPGNAIARPKQEWTGGN